MNKVFIALTIITIVGCNYKKNNVMNVGINIAFEQDHDHTPSYVEVIEFYEKLNTLSNITKLEKYGKTDSGHPLHTLVIDVKGEKSKPTLLINNAIHPGEPCGVDASMMFVRDLCLDEKYEELLKKVRVVVIPFYNIGGGLNRSSFSRANQVGPKYYGFRGNAKNLDLNRDFVKCDSKNAKTFNEIFNHFEPHIFIDTHTSNGADYQYVMTLIATQKDKLPSSLAQVLTDSMLPYLYDEMKNRNYEMTPYVYAPDTPDKGIYGFLDYPRYSSGYAALHHCISFMPETHMLKPYKDRVMSTYEFLHVSFEYVADHFEMISDAKEKAESEYRGKKKVAIDWKLNEEKVDSFLFKGFAAKYKKSEVTGKDRLYYDRNEPYTKSVNFFNDYQMDKEILVPKKYIIPQGYSDVIERLRWNKVEISVLEKDTVVRGPFYYIMDFEDQKAYEGHYLHKKVKLEEVEKEVQFYAGDIVIDTDQNKRRYIVETLEPGAPDSFFAWNFFDGILMQKEYFSPYVFEELAVELLRNDPELKQKFEDKKSKDEEFRDNAYQQLTFIYKNSPYYEQTHRRYPVARIF